MHINSFFMRSSAHADIARMFSPRSGHSSHHGPHGKSHQAHSHRAQAPGQNAPLRDAMKAIFEVLHGTSASTMRVHIRQSYGVTGIVVDGSDGDDAISFSSHSTSPTRNLVRGGDGDDTISFTATGATRQNVIEGGDGNDTISASVERSGYAFGGAGNDAVAISGTNVMGLGGDGDDAIAVAGTRYATAYGGAGNDAISVAGEYVHARGGSGDDTIAAAGGLVRVDGGEGNDTISVSAEKTGRISGGAGDDVMTISTQDHVPLGYREMATIAENGRIAGGSIEGGEGNDFITIDGEALVAFRAGDGQDTLTINDRTEFAILGESWGDDILSLDTASFAFEDGTLTVTWEGREESLTIHAAGGGDMTLEMTSDRTFVLTPG